MKKNIITSIITIMSVLYLATTVFAGDINISVAASMKDVFNELSADFGKTHTTVKFVKNYGASGALAKQVENGAPADLFISANPEWMEYLKKKNLVASSSISTFAYNTLVFAGTSAKTASMKDLLALNRIAIGSPKSVPAGEYATEAIKKAGLDQQLAKKLVMAKDVRECLMYAEKGEVDGAFVYKTDALQAKQAKILFSVPQELYPRVTYPMALTLAGAKSSDAVAFFTYLRSGAAKTVLAKYGFTTK